MFWIPIMMAASAILQKDKQNSDIKNQNRINKANTYAANQQQQGNSVIAAAKGALNRVNQSIQTRDALKAFGEQHNSLEQQRAKLGEQMTTGTFKNRVKAAEQQGMLAARSSGAGVGGSTVSMLEATMSLQADMAEAEMQQTYSDNLWAIDDAEKDNLYNQYGILQQQNVFLDDVAASTIAGPAKIPTNSVGDMAIAGAMAFLSSSNSMGAFSKGGSMDMSGMGGKLKSWFSPQGGGSSPGTGANSFFQIGGRV